MAVSLVSGVSDVGSLFAGVPARVDRAGLFSGQPTWELRGSAQSAPRVYSAPQADPLAQLGSETLDQPAVPTPVRRPAPRSRRFEHGSRPASSRPRSGRPAGRPASSLPSAPSRVFPVPVVRAGRRSLKLTRRGQVVLLLIVAASVYAAFGLGHASAGPEPAPSSAHQVVVQQGDSIWAIASRVAPNQDPRDVVGKIESLNHLHGSTVAAGQTLLLP
jgi:hypothetical protein